MDTAKSQPLAQEPEASAKTAAEPPLSPSRLARIADLRLSGGAHAPPNGEFQACVMEAVSYVAAEPWSDHPKCASPVISVFLRAWNDALPDDERTELLRPLIPRLVGTRASQEIEHRRSLMAADWLVRVQTPAWLRLAKLEKQAVALETLPEITSMAQALSIRGAIEAARDDAAKARAAAWAAARDAAWTAARTAARDAARAAARDAAWAAARDAAWDAAWDAARAAAWDAARTAAWDALTPTRKQLQQAALALVNRMIDCGGAP